ncbi:MAG: hypothetical protein IIB71_14635 [Proteobacteria bacterium]|nr:hypothetical protein [Pseudomonadota bacterium]
MRELTSTEVGKVSGGLDWDTGGALIISLGALTPVTFGFGLAIGGAMLFIDFYRR